MKNFLIDAIKALRDERMKVALSILGIVISVAAVIMIHITGKGISDSMQESVYNNKNGTSVELSVCEKRDGKNTEDYFMLESPCFTDENMCEFEERMKAVGIEFQRDDVVEVAEASYRNDKKPQEQWNLYLNGCSKKYAEENLSELKEGRIFSKKDENEAVAIIPQSFAEVYYGKANPIGKKMQMIGEGIYEYVKVIGVYDDELMDDTFLQKGQAKEAQIYLPLGYCRNRGYCLDIDGSLIMYTFQGGMDKNFVESKIRSFWKYQTELLDKDYDLQVSFYEKDIESFEKGMKILVWIITGIGALAFFIGAINVIQMMLIFVEEKWYEIGIKKALGAKNSDIYKEIFTQSFLIMFSGIFTGCLMGCLVGYTMHYKLALDLEQKDISFFFYFPWEIMLITCGVSVIISIIAVIVPIQRVKKMEICEVFQNAD